MPIGPTALMPPCIRLLPRPRFWSLKRLSTSPFPPHRIFHDPPLNTTTPDPDESFVATEQTLIDLFKSCTTMRDLAHIHARIIRFGFDQHVFVAGRLVSFCSVSDQGSMDYAAALFDQLRWPDGFLYNTMIRGFGRVSRAKEAFEFYNRMRQVGKLADNFTFCFLLKISGQMEAVELGRQLHGCVLKHGLASHVYVANTVIHMYAEFKDMVCARQVFEEMPNLDLVSWNALIDGYVCSREYREALDLFMRMKRSGFSPDEATLVVVLSACSELGDLDFGKQVHSRIGRVMLDQSACVCNSLIDMYAKCGAIDRAHFVFEEMQVRNVVSWNSIILGFGMHGHTEQAIKLFHRMKEEEFEDPNDITFLGVLCACSHGGLVEEGRSYFDSMRHDYSITPNIKHYGCMVDLLGRAGLIKEAYELIRSMPMEGNAVVWRTLLGACRVHGDLELGEQVQKHLRELEPDHSSDYVQLSHIYAYTGRWDDVFQVREEMRGRGVQKPEPGNSLVDNLSTVVHT